LNLIHEGLARITICDVAASIFRTDSRFLPNVGTILPDYTASCVRAIVMKITFVLTSDASNFKTHDHVAQRVSAANLLSLFVLWDGQCSRHPCTTTNVLCCC
jgi:hypothetical protein